MDQSQRLDLITNSVGSTNKKLNDVLDHKEEFLVAFQAFRESLDPNSSFKEKDDTEDILEGKDISVCSRVRPLLPYEVTAGYFETVISNQPKIHTFEPRFNFKKVARPVTTSNKVDFAFGPEHSNKDIYETAIVPLVDLGLKGGVATIFAYGQTGSGKTFTVSGIFEPLAHDIFKRGRPISIEQSALRKSIENEENCDNNAFPIRDDQIFAPRGDDIKIHVSVFELLGNDATDLLKDEHSAKSVEIVEDKFGKVQVKGVKEFEVNSADELISIVQNGFQHRKTETTFKNDASSRSHAVCQIRIENMTIKEAEDGVIFVVDLAGSENASDVQFHNKDLVSQTKLINSSLMALKECIRNRALAAVDQDTFYHVPYRLSKLTLLLRDAFALESRRLAKTVVIANVSPSCADISATLNTLKYVAPLKIGQIGVKKMDPNPNNPANWSNETLREWVTKASKGKVDPDHLCPYESGMQILRIHEVEFMKRVLNDPTNHWGEKQAKSFYDSLWKKLIDARTRERTNKLRRKHAPKRE